MPKTCLHPSCSYNVFGGGYCGSHQYLRDKKVSEKKDRGLFVREAQTADTSKDELNEWFKARERDIESAGGVCWETGERIDKKYYRHCTAHVLAKSLFPSVATHPLNFVVLSASNGSHAKFDVSPESASTMKVFKEALSRYAEFKHLVKEKHKILHFWDAALAK